MPARPLSPLWNSLALDRRAPLQDQIFAYFREGVLAGRLKGGTCVPSSRALAAEHGIARITAVQAYERLVAEGYLVPRAGAGLYVAESAPEHSLRAPEPPKREGARERRRAPRPAGRPAPRMRERPLGILALSPGHPALDAFPWREWSRITARVHRERPTAALGYGDPQGEPELRKAIAFYLGAARGIACEPEQVLIVSGSQQGVDLAARALAEPGDSVWCEEPGYPAGRAAFQAASLKTVAVPVDGEGIDVTTGARRAPAARIAFVSPAQQYPLGGSMSLRRRLALLDWAERADAWILEDDYAGDYRYAGRPLAPLHTLDRGNRVLFLGTFSKVLAPGLRLGYLIVPPGVVARFTAFKSAADRQPPGLTQRVLARFIAEGRLSAHLRRMRVLYAERREALIAALNREAPGLLDPGDAPEAGLHLTARLTVAADDEAVSRRALERRVHAPPLSAYYAGAKRERGFVLGFAATAAAQMPRAVRSLATAIDSVRQGA
jgi:GntR family transcriptional regulator / MocR family aminotransferase